MIQSTKFRFASELIKPLKDLISPNRSTEMSEYINLADYDLAESTHPYYTEMLLSIKERIRRIIRERGPLKVLVFGAGTGIDTWELLKLRGIVAVTVVDIDEECLEILKKKCRDPRLICHCDDMRTYQSKEAFDLIVTVFAHDHVPPEHGQSLMNNIYRNLKSGGYYIMGGEVLPHYKTEPERVNALFQYHLHIINKALLDFSFPVAHLEIEALRSGFEKIGDFKRDQKQLETELLSAPFQLFSSEKVGPVDQEVGGVFIYQLQKGGLPQETTIPYALKDPKELSAVVAPISKKNANL